MLLGVTLFSGVPIFRDWTQSAEGLAFIRTRCMQHWTEKTPKKYTNYECLSNSLSYSLKKHFMLNSYSNLNSLYKFKSILFEVVLLFF